MCIVRVPRSHVRQTLQGALPPCGCAIKRSQVPSHAHLCVLAHMPAYTSSRRTTRAASMHTPLTELLSTAAPPHLPLHAVLVLAQALSGALPQALQGALPHALKRERARTHTSPGRTRTHAGTRMAASARMLLPTLPARGNENGAPFGAPLPARSLAGPLPSRLTIRCPLDAFCRHTLGA